MSEVKSIFISHSEDQPAALLEELIRASYPGSVEVFNSTRASSGLAAGEPIDEGILARIEHSNVMIWLATPHSVGKSFWMSWELGVASAKGVRTIPCTCLGLPHDRLPLLQGGKNAPDLGNTEQLRRLLVSLREYLGLDTEKVAESINSLLPEQGRSQFWGREGVDTIVMRILGGRVLITNTSDDPIQILKAEVRGDEVAEIGTLERTSLDAKGRRVVEKPLGVEGSSIVYMEWEVPEGGRFFSSMKVRAE